jgi:predicted PurR-regulated permease PerM
MSAEGGATGPGREAGQQAAAPTDKLFTPAQLKFVRVVLLAVLAVVLAGVIILVLMGLAEVFSTFQALLLPVAVAGVLALILYPVSEFLHLRVHLPRVVAAAVVVTALVGALVAVMWLVVPTLLSQGAQMLEWFPGFVGRLHQAILVEWPEAGATITEQMRDVDWSRFLPEPEGALDRIGVYASLLVGIGFVPFFVFFLLLVGKRIEGVAEELTAIFDGETQRELRYLLDVFVEYIAAFFRGQLLIALIMAIMFAVGFTLIGLSYAVLIGALLGLLNIVPFLGTIIGVLTVLPLAYLQEGGGPELALLALGLFVVIQIIESWVLTPKIMHDRSGLHPMMVVVSLFFWGTLFGGIIGMLLAVPLSAFVATLWHRIRYRYTSRVRAPDQEIGSEIYVPDSELREVRELRED